MVFPEFKVNIFKSENTGLKQQKKKVFKQCTKTCKWGKGLILFILRFLVLCKTGNNY